MKRITLTLIFGIMMMLLLTGCFHSTDILEAEFEITSWEQNVSCGYNKEIHKVVVEGEDIYKCCPVCEECPECPACLECPILECPACPCCYLEWSGYIYIDYEVENIGNVDINAYKLFLIITLKDNTEYKVCIDGGSIPVGERYLFEQIKILIPSERAIFLKVESYLLE